MVQINNIPDSWQNLKQLLYNFSEAALKREEIYLYKNQNNLIINIDPELFQNPKQPATLPLN